MIKTVWQFKDEEVHSMPINTYGFVYLITYANGTKYIGKKQAVQRNRLAALKSGDVRPGAERVQRREPMTTSELQKRTTTQIRTNVKSKLVPYDMVTKESKWKDYEGSWDNLDNLEIAKKEILEFAPTGRSLTFLECKYLFCSDAIIDDDFHNGNILNKFHRGRLL